MLTTAKHVCEGLDKKEIVNRIMSETIGRSIEEIAKDTDRDNFMSADEAKEYGIVDHVIRER